MPRPPLTGRAFTSGERSRRQRQREAAELAALRAFVQWVADNATEPGIVAEARKMGATT